MRFVTLALLALLGAGACRALVRQGRRAAHDASCSAQLRRSSRPPTTRRAQRNEQLAAEVRDLKEGLEMVEEKARCELGMVKPDEILVQVSPPRR